MSATNEPSPGVAEAAMIFAATCVLKHRGIEITGGVLERWTPEELARGAGGFTLRPMALKGGDESA